MTIMPNNCRRVIGFLMVASMTLAQHDYEEYGDYQGDYQDYADDYQQEANNLYTDYAERQNQKAAVVGGGGGMGKILLGTGLGWLLGGRIHAGRTQKKLQTKHKKEAKELYTKYYNDVYKLQEQYATCEYMNEHLQETLKQVEQKAEIEAVQRDYEEFKQPDVDGDDQISRAEFNLYVKNYLSNYPGLEEKDYPKFEDFDHDKDGKIGFKEYSQQMALQVQEAELEQYYSSRGKR